MFWLTPFMKHTRDVAVGAYSHITGANDQVMSDGIFDLGVLVGSDPFILIVPFDHELADRLLGELRQIPKYEPGVFSGKLYFSAEGKIVADEHGVSSDEASRKRLIVAVPQAEYPTAFFAGALPDDFHQSEVAHPVMGEAVGLNADTELCGFQCRFHGLDELMVWDWHPGIRGIGCLDGGDLTARYFMCAAMQAEFGLRTGRTDVCQVDWHSVFPFCGCALTRLSGAD